MAVAQIDPNIALGVRPQPSLLEQYGAVQALKNAGMRSQLEGLQLKQAGQDYNDTQAERSAITNNTSMDPNTGLPTLNKAGVVGDLYQTAPTRGLAVQQQFTQQDIANSKAIADYKKIQLENAKNHVDVVGQLLQGVNDQPTYDKAHAAAIQAGIVQPGELPNVYDPQLVQQKLAQTMTQKDQITQLQKQQEMTETQRHDKATELNNQATSLQQGRATAIYAKPAAERTPEENAFIKGYEKNVAVTKIAPAEVRAQVMMQMPQAVYDPATGTTSYTTRKNAIGQQAPGTAENVAGKALLKDFTSGTDAHTLTAFNTAQGHLKSLDEAGDALQNGNVQVLNKIANAYGAATGDKAPVVFQAVKTAVGGEVAKAFTGAGATVSETEKIDQAINGANSPAQLKAVVQTYSHLLDTKKVALAQQFNQGKTGQPNFNAPAPASGIIRAVDSQGNLHQAPAGTPLPAGWKLQ